MAVKQLPHPDL